MVGAQNRRSRQCLEDIGRWQSAAIIGLDTDDGNQWLHAFEQLRRVDGGIAAVSQDERLGVHQTAGVQKLIDHLGIGAERQ
jgi:hypothetical protein